MQAPPTLLYFDDEQGAALGLAQAAGLVPAPVQRHRFPDGEIRLRLPDALPERVVLLRTLDHPNEKLVDLLLAARTARLLGARHLTLVAPECYERLGTLVGTSAQARKADYLFIDTAGRLHTKHNLMEELKKIHRILGRKDPESPHEVLLVVDATTGSNALQQAREFHKAVPLTGVIVTKLDGSGKGGVLVAIQQELGVPTRFIGLGERVEDFQPFDSKRFVEELL